MQVGLVAVICYKNVFISLLLCFSYGSSNKFLDLDCVLPTACL